MAETDSIRGARDASEAFPSGFRVALTELRAALSRDDSDGDREGQLNQLLDAVAAAAKTEGIAPDAAIVTLRDDWNRAAAFPVLMYSRLSRDEHRIRAIDTFLTACFAGPTGPPSQREPSSDDEPPA